MVERKFGRNAQIRARIASGFSVVEEDAQRVRMALALAGIGFPVTGRKDASRLILPRSQLPVLKIEIRARKQAARPITVIDPLLMDPGRIDGAVNIVRIPDADDGKFNGHADPNVALEDVVGVGLIQARVGFEIFGKLHLSIVSHRPWRRNTKNRYGAVLRASNRANGCWGRAASHQQEQQKDTFNSHSDVLCL